MRQEFHRLKPECRRLTGLDPGSDEVVWREYLETVVRERPEWRDFYRAARDA